MSYGIKELLLRFLKLLAMTKPHYLVVMLFLALVFLVGTNFFYLAAAWVTPEGKQYSGLNLTASADKLVYYSMIQQGIQGSLMQKNIHTGEAQIGALISPHWWLIGQSAYWLGLGVVTAYQSWRVLLSLMLVALLLLWVTRLARTYEDRIWLWLFVLFGAGWGWVAALIWPTILGKNFDPLISKSVDIYMGELSAFSNAQQSPLFILTHILLLAVFYLWARQRQEITWRSEGMSGALAALLIMVHPYDFWIVMTVPSIWSLWRWWRTNDRKYMFKLALFWSWCLIAAGLVWTLVNQEVAIKGWSAQNLVYSPPIYNFLIAWGLLLPLAVVGSRAWWTKYRDNQWWSLLVIWTWTTWILIYLPLDYNRRLANAWLIPASLVAGLGAITLAKKIKNTYRRLLYWLAVIALITFGPWYSQVVYFGAIKYYLQDERFYLSARTRELLQQVQAQPRDSVVLPFDESLGLLIPAFSGRTVYIGHQHQTINYLQKRQQVDEFFSPNTGMDKRNFLRSNKITLIVTHYSRQYPPEYFSWLKQVDYATLVDETAAGAIYQVR